VNGKEKYRLSYSIIQTVVEKTANNFNGLLVLGRAKTKHALLA